MICDKVELNGEYIRHNIVIYMILLFQPSNLLYHYQFISSSYYYSGSTDAYLTYSKSTTSPLSVLCNILPTCLRLLF